jgi:hypothetical protein
MTAEQTTVRSLASHSSQVGIRFDSRIFLRSSPDRAEAGHRGAQPSAGFIPAGAYGPADAAAGGDSAAGVEEVLDVGDAVFEQVAQPPRRRLAPACRRAVDLAVCSEGAR